MSLLDHPTICSRYFFPRASELADAFFVPVEGAHLACAWFRRHPDAPTILHFHGNGEIVGDYLGDIAEAMLGLGVDVCFAEYRGYGASSGSPTLLSLLQDAEAILRALALPPEQVIVFGRSIGSLPAIHLASCVPALGGLILESGIADLLERLLVRVHPEKDLGCSEQDLAAQVALHFNHQDKLSRYHGPFLALHTLHDHLIHWTHAQRNHDWVASSLKEIVLFEAGDHNSILPYNWHKYWRAVRKFLQNAHAL